MQTVSLILDGAKIDDVRGNSIFSQDVFEHEFVRVSDLAIVQGLSRGVHEFIASREDSYNGFLIDFDALDTAHGGQKTDFGRAQGLILGYDYLTGANVGAWLPNKLGFSHLFRNSDMVRIYKFSLFYWDHSVEVGRDWATCRHIEGLCVFVFNLVAKFNHI